MSKAEIGQNLGRLLSQVMNEKEKFFKEIKSVNSVNRQMVMVTEQNSLIADMENVLVVQIED